MTLWVDGDSCDRKVRLWLESETNFSLWNIIIVVDKTHYPKKLNPERYVIVEEGKDKVDNYIFKKIERGDIVITRDLLFAKRLVDNEHISINDNGLKFSKEYLKMRLEERDISLALKAGGLSARKSSKQFNSCNLDNVKSTLLGLMRGE